MAKAHLTPEGWRCEKLREHLYRARWMDYQSPSIQMLTLVTVDRRPLLSVLQGNTVALTALGSAVAAEIERIPTYLGAASIEILDYVIMPDHVHILLHIHDRLPRHLGQYIRWFKVQCSDAFTAMVETAREVMAGTGMAGSGMARGDSRENNNANANASNANTTNANNANNNTTNANNASDTNNTNASDTNTNNNTNTSD
ncbi:MAG: transposase, partial [Alistipes sp.]|nr:transposase [Alistipes sp.]